MAYDQSLWFETAGEDWTPRPPLPGDREADIVIVGAGLTGLWTAYYLTEVDPTLRVVVVEAEIAGFGASGRNGGWCSALFPRSTAGLAGMAGPEAAIAMTAAMRATVDEVADVLRRERLDADFAKGGTVVAARGPAQRGRAHAEVADARRWGATPDDLALLTGEELRQHVRIAGAEGGTYTPHCAALHPAKLVRGLARVLEARGVVIHEQTPAIALAPGRVTTTRGTVRAEVVVRATEGYTPSIRGQRRAVAPVYSLMVATESLPAEVWERIGLERRQTFSDFRNVIIYGQRTADDRLAFGGRGAPYHFGSRVRAGFEDEPRVFAALRATLVDLFPVLADAKITHRWGGALGVPRDWCASVAFDPQSGAARAGGYVGDGLSTTNLAGRTLSHLILRRDTDLVRLPWVGHRSPVWEPEPLRWLGINAGLKAMELADVEERWTGRPSGVARLMRPLIGG